MIKMLRIKPRLHDGTALKYHSFHVVLKQISLEKER